MPLPRTGQHGGSRFTPIYVAGPDSREQSRRWDIEEAAFVLLGAAPWRSFYEHGAWHIAYIRDASIEWFVETFGDVDVAVFRAINAKGPDTFDGVAFERMK